MAALLSKAKGAKDFLGRFVFTSSISFQRLSNLVKTAVNYGLKRQVIDSYPPRLFIDPVNACVLHCPLCPTGKGEKGRAIGNMKFTDFQKILDEVGPYLYELDLYNWGEPFLNKDIWEMIAYARKKGVKVRISSNMNYWKEGFAENIVDSGLDQLIVSCDGTDQKSYAKYRIGGDFGKVMAHVKQVAMAKKRLGRKNPKLIWQFLVMRQNEHQV